MKCTSCNKENPDNLKFCNNCGAPFSGDMKRCENGHNYGSHEPYCPYCPPPGDAPTQMANVGTANPGDLSDRTIIDGAAPKLQQGSQPVGMNDKTVITNGQPVFVPQHTGAGKISNRRLVGWLVTYDISEYGTDFRIYEGRTKLGRNSDNDIVLNHTGVSDKHALMLYRDGKFIIDDELSTNGTYVNHKSIDEKTQLVNDDVIGIGTISLKLKVI